eukprot:m.1268 g.1268  ORF g.1268 m.1268 type:complete len:80 (+) comp449_c1_seq1:539-778(+)
MVVFAVLLRRRTAAASASPLPQPQVQGPDPDVRLAFEFAAQAYDTVDMQQANGTFEFRLGRARPLLGDFKMVSDNDVGV